MSEDFLRDKLDNIEMQVKFVMSIKEELVMSSDQRSSVINMPEIIVILFTGRLPCVQCTKNRLTCENYTANYKIFQEHQLNSVRLPVFPEAISNSGRFPGVVNILVTIAGRRSYKSFQQQTSVGCGRGHTPVLR